jgi:hypothetical protein
MPIAPSELLAVLFRKPSAKPRPLFFAHRP